MFFAYSEATGKRVHAKVAVNKYDSFICPCCNENLVLKNGTIKATHFSHKSNTKCVSWQESSNVMSEWHQTWQARFPDECREVVFENNGERHIADVSYNGYIIEFQHSRMSADEFIERTKFYSRCKKRKLIWIFDLGDEFNNDDGGFFIESDGLVEYELDKWKWKNPKRTFAKFEPQYDYWKRNVCLMFETPQSKITRIVWCIHKPNSNGGWMNNYSRFCTKNKFELSDFMKALDDGRI